MGLWDLVNEHWAACYALALLASFWWPICAAVALKGPRTLTVRHPAAPPEKPGKP